jgi:multidrug efflux system membrane fusion protein
MDFVVAMSVVMLAACHPAKPPEAALQTVRAGAVQEIRPDAPEKYSATIVAAAQVDLAFKSAGLIQRIHQVRGADGRVHDAEAGDRVEEGTELALVRTVDYEQKVRQAEQQANQAEAQLSHAEVMQRQAQQDFDRADRLYKTASLTRPDYDQAKTRLDGSKEQARAASAQLDTARTAISEAKLSLCDTSVRAPFTGWITARNVQRGSLAGNATVGFSMVDTHVVKAIFAVPDISLRNLRLGQRLTVLLDALTHPVTGAVTSIAPQADPRTHVFAVEVSIANGSGEIRPGMVGSLTLSTNAEPTSRLVVPLSAVVRAPGNPDGYAVYRIVERDGKSYVAARPIAVGATFGNSIEVASGAKAGDPIVALGGELVRDGQEVRVLH